MYRLGHRDRRHSLKNDVKWKCWNARGEMMTLRRLYTILEDLRPI